MRLLLVLPNPSSVVGNPPTCDQIVMHNNMLPLCFLRLYKYQFIEAIYSSMAEMRGLLEKQGYVALPYEYPNGFDEPEEDQRDDCLYVCVGGNMSI